MSQNTPRLEWRSDPPLAAESATVRSDAGVEYLVRRTISDASAGAPLPVIIVLDGAHHFAGFAAMAQRLSERPDATGVGPAVVVGIDSLPPLTRRFEDFTPWAPEDIADAPTDTLGRADAFLEALVSKIVPALLADDRIDATRIGLVGHSLGGYFALYAATQTRLFKTIGAFSPSLWWNAPRLLRALEASDISATSFTLSVGSRETHATRRMIERAHEFGQWLSERASSTKTLLADGEDHGSTPFASFPTYLRSIRSTDTR